MYNVKRTLLIVIVFCVIPGSVYSLGISRSKANPKKPTAFELLDKYAENADKMKSIIFKTYSLSEIVRTYSTPGQPAMKRKMHSEDEHRVDGKRGFWSFTRWGNVVPGGAWRDKGDVYGSRLYDGKCFYQYGKSRNSKTYPNGRVYLTRSNVRKGNIQLATESMLLGFHSGNNGRIDKVLRKGRRVSVRERMENVGGANCYVIDAVTRYGRQMVWIDPERGHNVRKLVIIRRPGDKNGSLTLKKGQKYDYHFEVQHFKKVENAWIPEQYSSRMAQYFNPKDVHRGKGGGKLIEVKLNPDHEALGSFSPDDVQNGAVVSIIGVKRKSSYRWRDGQVVDKSGQLVFDSNSKKTSSR
ncbi:MAG: hypothetical protein WBC22_15960 [Sedimentisphaerales bacterium]